MQMLKVEPVWSGFSAPPHHVHLAELPDALPGEDDPLPPLVDASEWSTFRTDKRRKEHLGGRLLLGASMDGWWKERGFVGRTDELDVVRVCACGSTTATVFMATCQGIRWSSRSASATSPPSS